MLASGASGTKLFPKAVVGAAVWLLEVAIAEWTVERARTVVFDVLNADRVPCVGRYHFQTAFTACSLHEVFSGAEKATKTCRAKARERGQCI